MSRNGTPEGSGPGPSVVPVVPSIPGVRRTYSPENSELRSFVYTAGFLHAAWADTVLSVSGFPVLHLHALFASQSPVLYQLLSSTTPSGPHIRYHLTLAGDDPNLTAPAVSTVLATLYGHPIELQSCDPSTAWGLLAAASLFGLESVGRQAYDLLLRSLSVETLPELLEVALSRGEGTAGPYPIYTQGLVPLLVDFLLRAVDASQPLPPSLEKALLLLPFGIYKQVVESDKLRIATSMDRHNFAKNVTARRAAHIRKQVSAGRMAAPTFEEHVVLSFGGGSNGVEVVQKPKKRTKAAK